ncbi:MAG: hypothetical protein WCT17_05755, partial [Bacilli bacterium]
MKKNQAKSKRAICSPENDTYFRKKISSLLSLKKDEHSFSFIFDRLNDFKIVFFKICCYAEFYIAQRKYENAIKFLKKLVKVYNYYSKKENYFFPASYICRVYRNLLDCYLNQGKKKEYSSILNKYMFHTSGDSFDDKKDIKEKIKSLFYYLDNAPLDVINQTKIINYCIIFSTRIDSFPKTSEENAYNDILKFDYLLFCFCQKCEVNKKVSWYFLDSLAADIVEADGVDKLIVGKSNARKYLHE